MSDVQIRNPVLSAGSENFLLKRIQLSRRLVKLRVADDKHSSTAPSTAFRSFSGWKKPRGGQ